MARLVFANPGGPRREYQLAALNTLGRNRDNTIPIGDELVSKYQCQIVRIGASHYLLRDCGSLNGTFVGNLRVTEHALTHGDEFRVGDTIVRFEGDAVPSASSSTSSTRVRGRYPGDGPTGNAIPASMPTAATGKAPSPPPLDEDPPQTARRIADANENLSLRLNELTAVVAQTVAPSGQDRNVVSVLQRLVAEVAELRAQHGDNIQRLFASAASLAEQSVRDRQRIDQLTRDRTQMQDELKSLSSQLGELRQQVRRVEPVTTESPRRNTAAAVAAVPAAARGSTTRMPR